MGRYRLGIVFVNDAVTVDIELVIEMGAGFKLSGQGKGVQNVHTSVMIEVFAVEYRCRRLPGWRFDNELRREHQQHEHRHRGHPGHQAKPIKRPFHSITQLTPRGVQYGFING